MVLVHPHHAQSIQNVIAAFESDPTVAALLLGGSLAHGFARPDSDIDISIVVDAAEYERRRRENRLHYVNHTLCTYPQGYVDGKYVDEGFLRSVAERGSDPARYAFEGARVLFSRMNGLEGLLAAIGRYPVEQKRERIERFTAQLLAWRWYHGEALRQQSDYLRQLALHKLALFGARIVLAENELFFPYHKWMLRVLEGAPRKPPGLLADIQAIVLSPPREKVEAYCQTLLDFIGVDEAAANQAWPMRFMTDTELRWVQGEPSIDDL
jgi:nucleotidyltransferase-like protein